MFGDVWYFLSLATETEYVRARLALYANDLLSLGVDGLRLDAAKRRHLTSPVIIKTEPSTQTLRLVISKTSPPVWMGAPISLKRYEATYNLFGLRLIKRVSDHFRLRGTHYSRDVLAERYVPVIGTPCSNTHGTKTRQTTQGTFKSTFSCVLYDPTAYLTCL